MAHFTQIMNSGPTSLVFGRKNGPQVWFLVGKTIKLEEKEVHFFFNMMHTI